METKKRPVVVTIAAWVIIILSCLGLLSALVTPLALISPEAVQKIEDSGQTVGSVILWGSFPELLVWFAAS
jgi:hypothetical protein